MATIKLCDRCGSEINPKSSAVYVLIRNTYGDIIGKKETELCCSCAMQLREFLRRVTKKEGADNG